MSVMSKIPSGTKQLGTVERQHSVAEASFFIVKTCKRRNF